MTKRYYSQTELDKLQPDEHGVLPALVYSLRGPLPQMLLVTDEPGAQHSNPTVRTVNMTPLSWGPYTKAISIPLADSAVAGVLSQPGAQCVLAEPTRHMLRQLTICSQFLPRGLSQAAVARLTLLRSLYVDVPSLADCPVNLECRVEHSETYYGNLIVFVRIVGASIDDSVLFWEREQITRLFPTNDVDSIVDAQGNVTRRVGIMGDLFLCPTFPCAPKQGWYGAFDTWMKELCDEGYLRPEEYEKAIAWHTRWQQIFSDLRSDERPRLRTQLTELCRLIADEQWDDLHAFLAL